MHRHTFDDMAAAIIVAFEAIGTGANGHNRRGVIHDDIGSLQHIEVAVLHNADRHDELLQLFDIADPIRIVLGALA